MNPVVKRIVTGLAVAAAVILAILFAPPLAIRVVCLVLAVFAMLEVCQLTGIKVRELRAAGHSAALAYEVQALFSLALILLFATLSVIAARHGNMMLLYVIAIVKFSDTGGFAFGLTSAKLMKGGNHKLCPTVSPNKSWEGLLGSVVFSTAVSCAFVPVTHFGFGKAAAFGVAAALVGTAGDLVESKFKRWVGVKDSSTMKITNGLGGFLDMFDSLLFAPSLMLPFLGS